MLVLIGLFSLIAGFLIYYCVKLHRRIQILEHSLLSALKLLTNIGELSEANSKSIRGLTNIVASLNESYSELEVSMINFSEETMAVLEHIVNQPADGKSKIKLN